MTVLARLLGRAVRRPGCREDREELRQPRRGGRRCRGGGRRRNPWTGWPNCTPFWFAIRARAALRTGEPA